jgi:mRNA-degrading endonuclease YafQ of YafQ-DinJ toxin-antitoxin module
LTIKYIIDFRIFAIHILKKIVAISLLLILLFAYGGYWIVFKLQQYHIRSEVKQAIKNGISEEEISTFVLADLENLPANEFAWVHAKEFKLNGAYYDVIRTEVKGDSVLLFCFHDFKESQLFASLDRIIAMKMGEHEPLQKNISSLNSLLKSLFLNEFTTLNSYGDLSIKLNMIWQNLYLPSCIFYIFSPPD